MKKTIDARTIQRRLMLISKLVFASLVASCVLPDLIALTTAAGPTTTGTWTLYPPQVNIYSTAVHPPIKADGTSAFNDNGHNVIPIQLKLMVAPGPIVFRSIWSNNPDPDPAATDDFSFLSFRPSPSLTFAQITNLKANYDFTMGNCGGGSLRWSVKIDLNDNGVSDLADGNIFIYYGAHPNFTDCLGINSQSGQNMIGQPELRYDTSQIGGMFYDSYEHAVTLAGTHKALSASLVIDSGWFNGDQKLNINNATVNDNAFVPLMGAPMQICELPPAEIKVTKISDSGGVISNPISIQPHDNDGQFRIVDCKYMYNLATGSLLGAGVYKVEAVINGNPVAGAAQFTLR